jgi:hypothetical protein
MASRVRWTLTVEEVAAGLDRRDGPAAGVPDEAEKLASSQLDSEEA